MAINIMLELGEHPFSRHDQQNFEFFLSEQVSALIARLSTNSQVPVNVNISFIDDYQNHALNQADQASALSGQQGAIGIPAS